MSIYEKLMSHDLTLVKRTGGYTGDLSDGPTFNEKGFIQYTNTQMVSDDGEKITAKAIVFLKADTNFDESHGDWAIEHNGHRFIKRSTERIDDPRTGDTHHYELGAI